MMFEFERVIIEDPLVAEYHEYYRPRRGVADGVDRVVATTREEMQEVVNAGRARAAARTAERVARIAELATNCQRAVECMQTGNIDELVNRHNPMYTGILDINTPFYAIPEDLGTPLNPADAYPAYARLVAMHTQMLTEVIGQLTIPEVAVLHENSMLSLVIDYLHANIRETEYPDHVDRIPALEFPDELCIMVGFVSDMSRNVHTRNLVPDRTKAMIEALNAEANTGVPCEYTINEPQYILK